MSTVAAEQARATFQGDGALAVEGALTFDTVPDALQQTASWLQKPGGAITVDLRGVTRADSAGLALLIEWLRLARAKDRKLMFINMPEQVRSLIRVNNLGHALDVDNHN